MGYSESWAKVWDDERTKYLDKKQKEESEDFKREWELQNKLFKISVKHGRAEAFSLDLYCIDSHSKQASS